ncbi:hypothetical protein ACWCW7_33060 [Nocardia tengchongensis]|uniref:Uncharacterized protein n=1 Tax=Nocardia tengchongensis TaxID=2055889 RepID=A0ABX8CVK3_9NOCA|nr:hypothetical protein [Nocardia tengchongensis]QVI23931.1 hypothetical protein KHQ06_14655 [Nocardia tengchongensis]
MRYTVETATAYVIEALEAKGTATREDFDVTEIVSTTHNITQTWDFRAVDRGRFWGIAATFLRA